MGMSHGLRHDGYDAKILLSSDRVETEMRLLHVPTPDTRGDGGIGNVFGQWFERHRKYGIRNAYVYFRRKYRLQRSFGLDVCDDH